MTSVKEFPYVHAYRISQAFEYVCYNDLKMMVFIKVWSPVQGWAQVQKVMVYECKTQRVSDDTFDIDIQHMKNARGGTDKMQMNV